MDLIDITTVGVLALTVGLVTGWLVARSRFTTTVADLNSKLVLERRVNKQLSEAAQVAAVSNFMPAADLKSQDLKTPDLKSPDLARLDLARLDLASADPTSATEPVRESMVLSG